MTWTFKVNDLFGEAKTFMGDSLLHQNLKENLMMLAMKAYVSSLKHLASNVKL